MARSRKRKSAAQHIVGLATMGLPRPIGTMLESRSGAPLALLLVVVLVGTGILTIRWSNGLPSITVDHDRANVVKQTVEGRIGSLGSGSAEESAIARFRAMLSTTNSSNDTPLTTAGQNATTLFPLAASSPPATTGFPTPSTDVSFAPTPQATITIASFNIQVFGVSKLQKPQAMAVLADVVQRFDVVAIQEVRSVDDTVLPQFVALINSRGARYGFIIGPRLGRTNSKEQYAVLFNTDRIEVDPSSIYTIPDPLDLLHREPMVARFRVRGPPPERAFTFTLVNIHTDPDEVESEVDALADVFLAVQSNGSGEDDVILLGDLNASDQQLGRLGSLPNVGCAIRGVMTNTRKNRMYDNVVFSWESTREYTGRYGVLDLVGFYGLSEAEALEISDHLPVWTEFNVYESWHPGEVANRSPTIPR